MSHNVAGLPGAWGLAPAPGAHPAPVAGTGIRADLRTMEYLFVI
jgi:hypothetical protein